MQLTSGVKILLAVRSPRLIRLVLVIDRAGRAPGWKGGRLVGSECHRRTAMLSAR